jgi:hypothetical protein
MPSRMIGVEGWVAESRLTNKQPVLGGRMSTELLPAFHPQSERMAIVLLGRQSLRATAVHVH